jgi:thioesterase domain-containing protein
MQLREGRAAHGAQMATAMNSTVETARGGGTLPSSLVLMKPGDTGAPLFLVHGLGGKVDELSTIARHVETNRAVYGIEAPGSNGDEPVLADVAKSARLYVDAIRKPQPSGPYFLAGFSYGGIVAFEMAQIIRAEGGEVALLFLIDAYAHPRTWPLRERVGLRARVLANRVKLVFKRGAGGTLRVITRRLAEKKTNSVEGSLGSPAPARRWPGAPEPSLPFALQRVHEAGTLALETFVPRFYPGRIYFVTTETPAFLHPRRPARLLEKLATSYKLHVVPGHHLSLVKDNAGLVAACISRSIARVEQG